MKNGICVKEAREIFGTFDRAKPLLAQPHHIGFESNIVCKIGLPQWVTVQSTRGEHTFASPRILP